MCPKFEKRFFNADKYNNIRKLRKAIYFRYLHKKHINFWILIVVLCFAHCKKSGMVNNLWNDAINEAPPDFHHDIHKMYTIKILFIKLYFFRCCSNTSEFSNCWFAKIRVWFLIKKPGVENAPSIPNRSKRTNVFDMLMK